MPDLLEQQRMAANSLVPVDGTYAEKLASASVPRVAFTVGGLYTEASGVARIVCDLANALSQQGLSVPIYTAECSGRRATDHMLDAPNRCIACPGSWLGRLSHSPALRYRLEHDIAGFDVIHNHSLWMLPNHYSSAAARRGGKPVIFTMHGTLEPWALSRSRWKKWIAGWWFQNRDLREARCLHVNSVSEIAGLRAYGLRNPIAVIPNGVDLAPFDAVPQPDRFRERFLQTRDSRIVLFLSRLHEKKGLVHLIRAWARLMRDFDGWKLVIAGPDDGFEASARALTCDLGAEEKVIFTGSLRGEAKVDALAAAEVFSLPSFSEGFSMAVLEAMAARLPVLITPGCNFPEVEHEGAGIVAEANVDATERGLRELMSNTDEQRHAMGLYGRAMVEKRYTWDVVAAEMLDLYRWAIYDGPAPLHCLIE